MNFQNTCFFRFMRRPSCENNYFFFLGEGQVITWECNSVINDT